MQKREKIGIIIVIIFIILAIILVVILWTGRTSGPIVKVNCATACHQVGNLGWTFPGAGPVSKNSFQSQDQCVSACQTRFGK